MSNKPNDFFMAGDFNNARNERRLRHEATVVIGKYNDVVQDLCVPNARPSEALELHTITLSADRQRARIRFMPLNDPLARVAFKIATVNLSETITPSQAFLTTDLPRPPMDAALN